MPRFRSQGMFAVWTFIYLHIIYFVTEIRLTLIVVGGRFLQNNKSLDRINETCKGPPFRVIIL